MSAAVPRFQPKDADTCLHEFTRALKRQDPGAALALLPHLTPSLKVHSDRLHQVVDLIGTSPLGREALAILVRSPHPYVAMAATSVRLDRFPDDVHYDHHVGEALFYVSHDDRKYLAQTFAETLSGGENGTFSSVALDAILMTMQQNIEVNGAHTLEYLKLFPELKYARAQLNVYANDDGELGGGTYSETQMADIGEKLSRPETQKMLLAIGSEGHAMLLRLEKGPMQAEPGTQQQLRVSIINTGLGYRSNHELRDPSITGTMRAETTLTYGGVDKADFASVHLPALLRRVAREDHPQFIYDWAKALPGAHKLTGLNVAHSVQKTGNCTIQCIQGFLKNNLSDSAYRQIRASLFETTASSYRGGPSPDPQVVADLNKKSDVNIFRTQTDRHEVRTLIRAYDQFLKHDNEIVGPDNHTDRGWAGKKKYALKQLMEWLPTADCSQADIEQLVGHVAGHPHGAVAEAGLAALAENMDARVRRTATDATRRFFPRKTLCRAISHNQGLRNLALTWHPPASASSADLDRDVGLFAHELTTLRLLMQHPDPRVGTRARDALAWRTGPASQEPAQVAQEFVHLAVEGRPEAAMALLATWKLPPPRPGASADRDAQIRGALAAIGAVPLGHRALASLSGATDPRLQQLAREMSATIEHEPAYVRGAFAAAATEGEDRALRVLADWTPSPGGADAPIEVSALKFLRSGLAPERLLETLRANPDPRVQSAVYTHMLDTQPLKLLQDKFDAAVLVPVLGRWAPRPPIVGSDLEQLMDTISTDQVHGPSMLEAMMAGPTERLRRAARLESDRRFPLLSFDAAQGDNDRLTALLRGWQPAPEAKVQPFIDRVEATLGREGLNVLRQYSRSDAVRAYVDQIW